MKHSWREISSVMILSSLLACSRTPVGTTQHIPDQGVPLTTAKIMEECVNPHKVYALPPQPIPGIPVMIIRHAECLGYTNILLAWWPGPNSKLNFLYIEMLVEKYVQELKKDNEHFKQKLLLVEKVIPPVGEKPDIPKSHMAVYKLKHVPQKEQK